jgi:hypothetical protein
MEHFRPTHHPLLAGLGAWDWKAARLILPLEVNSS